MERGVELLGLVVEHLQVQPPGAVVEVEELHGVVDAQVADLDVDVADGLLLPRILRLDVHHEKPVAHVGCTGMNVRVWDHHSANNILL